MTRRFALVAALAITATAGAATAKPRLDRSYARSFKQAWNRVDPHAPILQDACLRVPHPQQGVAVIEACLIVERTPTRAHPRASSCFEAYLAPVYSDPLQAVESAAAVGCAAARQEIVRATRKAGYVA